MVVRLARVLTFPTVSAGMLDVLAFLAHDEQKRRTGMMQHKFLCLELCFRALDPHVNISYFAGHENRVFGGFRVGVSKSRGTLGEVNARARESICDRR